MEIWFRNFFAEDEFSYKTCEVTMSKKVYFTESKSYTIPNWTLIWEYFLSFVYLKKYDGLPFNPVLKLYMIMYL